MREQTAGLNRASLTMSEVGISTADEPQVVSFSGTFTGIDLPDTHFLPVQVPTGVNAIEVSYDYSPLAAGADPADVVDIGIFDPERYRGRSSGARRSFRIATDSATEGFIGGIVDPGEWRIALEPFGVVPPGVVWSVEVTLHFGPASEIPVLSGSSLSPRV
jgi:hypothetical protein